VALRFYGTLDRLFSPPRAKASKPGLFAVLTGKSAPDPLGPELLDAFRGWVYACVNAIAEEIAAIDLRLEHRTRDGWVHVDDHLALGPLHKVNDLMSSYDLFLGAQAIDRSRSDGRFRGHRRGVAAGVEQREIFRIRVGHDDRRRRLFGIELATVRHRHADRPEIEQAVNQQVLFQFRARRVAALCRPTGKSGASPP
jgi:hypothetical protein